MCGYASQTPAETGLYYLQSRYYNPQTGRFINADGLVSTGQGLLGNNMFAYCGNDPVLNIDTQGTRYCEATSVSKEDSWERAYSCRWQGQITLEKYNPKPIGYVECGNVYLVTDISEIKTNFPGDIIVLDKRACEAESYVEIRYSFLITDIELQRNVLELLYNYEASHPTIWNRTVESMLLEWDVHNEGASLGSVVPFAGKLYEKSIHVCFDNRSEGWSKWDHYVDGARKLLG